MSVYTGIPVNSYLTTQAESDVKSLGYLRVGGQDLLVYTTVEGFLRVKELVSKTCITLDHSVIYSYPVNLPDANNRYRVYYVKRDGTIWVLYLINLLVPPQKIQLSSLSLLDSPTAISVVHGSNTNVPRWIMLISNSSSHVLATSSSETFSVGLKYRTIYDNQQGSVKALNPVMALHNGGTTVTVAVDFLNTSTGETGVGTYVAPILEETT